MLRKILFAELLVFLFGCALFSSKGTPKNNSNISLVVLGTIQDAGSPQAGCQKSCCKDLWINPVNDRKIVSLGLIDHNSNQTWLFEASPDLISQTNALSDFAGIDKQQMPDGIFITHAHIGHYTGLMFLGRESLGANEIPVYAMPKMKIFLEENGPWSQLVQLKNIVIQSLTGGKPVSLTDDILVTPFYVPHRDEYSETVGFKIQTPNKKVLFIPDIDKWSKWDTNIIDEIKKVDLAFIDGTFYANGEIPNRDMSLIPHPFVEESLALFSTLSETEKAKVHFIHFNHTNPLINKESDAFKNVIKNGFNVAQFHQVFDL